METRNFMGIEWGNDSHEPMVISVIADSGEEVLRSYIPNRGWAAQRNQLMGFFNRLQPVVILAETDSIGSVNIAALQSEGLPIRGISLSRGTKQTLQDHLKLRLEKGDVRLMYSGVLDDYSSAVTLSVWAKYRYSGGNISFA